MKYFEVFAFLVIFIDSFSCGKPHKRVVIHIPMKVKHHHHTHTIYKPIHHSLPVKVENDHWDGLNDEYHIGNGRMLESLLGDWKQPQYSYPHETEDESDEQYEHFDKLLKKFSKNKKKLFNNKSIGWNGRQNFDKIASEYLSNLKKHPQPDYDDYEERYAPYDDEDEGTRRK